MRIDLTRPLPGLLMALPLIAILMSVGRTPIAMTEPLSRAKEAMIETTGTSAIICAPNIDAGRAIAGRLGNGVRDRWAALALVGEEKWRNRPEAAIGCEVVVSCQPRSIVRRFALYD
jgi:hypothetical protein